MRTGAIIAEYNPFHNGHQYQINKFRQDYHLDYVIVLMSGNFTQRGEPAWMSKYQRTQCALLGGADLVLELPAYYATGSASLFAEGAIAHLNQLNCVDWLCFGCEISGEENEHLMLLEKAADILNKEPPVFKTRLAEGLKKGLSYPSAREYALKGCMDNTENLFSPNNILALEYISALKRTHSAIKPAIIKREGSDYYSTSAEGNFLSATALRNLLKDDRILSSGKGIPVESRIFLCQMKPREFPVELNDFSAMFAACFIASKTTLTEYVDVTEEISNRMLRFFDEYQNLSDYLILTKNKSYTYTRLCRCAVHILLNIKKDILCQSKADGYAYYARVLGFRKAGSPLLASIKKHSSIPLIGKMADYSKLLTDDARTFLEADIYAADIYRMACQMKFGYRAKNEFNQQIIIL